jgi:hypothetical protein
MYNISHVRTARAHGLVRALTVGAFAGATVIAVGVAPAWGQAPSRIDPAVRAEFREPVTLATKDGVLEIRLTARQGQADARHGRQARRELPAVQLRADPRYGVRRQDLGQQSLSRTDAAGVPRREADRPLRQCAHRLDDPGFL